MISDRDRELIGLSEVKKCKKDKFFERFTKFDGEKVRCNSITIWLVARRIKKSSQVLRVTRDEIISM